MDEKLEINADIEKIITGAVDQESIERIIEFGNRIPVSLFFRSISAKSEKRSSKGVVGHTPQHGNVSTTDNRGHFEEKTKGWFIDRVGYYKMWRESGGEIRFSHWKNDFTNMAKAIEEEVVETGYYIYYNEETLEPKSFGVFETFIISGFLCKAISSTVSFFKSIFLSFLTGRKIRAISIIGVEGQRRREIWSNN